MGILKNNFLVILILLGLLIRLLLSPLPGFKIDVDAWFAWAVRLHTVGLSSFYSDQIFTVFAPGYLYILWLLGFLKSLLRINSDLFYLIVKLPNIISEIFIAILVYFFLKKNYSINIAKIATVVILFNPGFIFNSSIWGQTDSTLALFILITIYLLYQQKIVFSSIFLGLSLLIKPQAVSIFPAIALYALKNFRFRNMFLLAMPAILTIFILSLPYFPHNPVTGLAHFIENSFNEYHGNSLFAYNFWGIFGFWVDDNKTFGMISMQQWGYLLFLSYWLIIMRFFFKKKISLFSLAALSTLSFYFLPTRVHERYLYSGLLFLILLSVRSKNKLLSAITIILNVLYFLNLYYVYIYYNHFYFKMPSILFWEQGYNLLDTNGRSLSLISTICFIIITWLIIKTEPDKNVQ